MLFSFTERNQNFRTIGLFWLTDGAGTSDRQ